MITARGPFPETAQQDVKHRPPRFPREWLDEVEEKVPRVPQQPRRQWSLILLGAVVAAVLIPTWVGQQGPGPPAGALPHTFWTEGVVERVGAGQEGTLSVTVVGMTGKSATALLDFDRTSVFQPGCVLHVGHLKPGQHVRMVWVRDQARSIEILP